MSPCQAQISKVDTGAGASGTGGAAPGVDSGQAGFWAPSMGPLANAGAQNMVANQARGLRVVCPKTMTITKIGFAVAAVASVDDPVDVGIYDASLNRLGSSGSTLGKLTSLGRQQINLVAPVVVTQGVVYYAVFGYGAAGGTVAQVMCASEYSGGLNLLFPAGMEGLFWNATFPLPATLGASGNLNAPPILALMQ